MALRRAARLIVVAALVAIAYFTLFPFDFHVPAGRTLRSTLASFDTTTDASYVYEDLPLNVLLFAPLGFGVAALLVARRGRRASRVAAVALAGAAAFAVSGLAEFVQGFSLARFPSAADLLANTVGGAVGAVVFAVAGEPILQRGTAAARWIGRRMTATRLALGCAVYVVVLTGLLVWSPAATELRGWDPEYHLLVGNEESGDRPWDGTIEQLHVLDRSIADDVVGQWRTAGPAALDAGTQVVRHDFAGGGAAFPELRWQGEGGGEATTGAAGARLGPDAWMRSPAAAADVSAALASTSQFTVLLRAATADVGQGGPARLVSISAGVFDRNVTIGQQGADLVLRLRMPLTGSDGSDPEMVVPDVFVDEDVHDIVVRYDGSTVRVGVDGAARSGSFELAPEAVVLLGSYPSGVEAMRSTVVRAAMFRAVPRLVLFVPVGASLAWWWRRRHYDRRRDLTGAAGVVAVALALPLSLEVLLSSMIGPYAFRPALVVLGAATIGAGAAFARPWRMPARAVPPGRSTEAPPC
jgi:glycopeptide antibiotics resistance protein